MNKKSTYWQDKIRDRIALFILLAIAGALIAYQMSSRPETDALKKDILATAFAPPYWVLVRDWSEAKENCLSNARRASSVFPCFYTESIGARMAADYSIGWSADSRLQRWRGEIRILSLHPDKRIEEHLKILVPYIQGKTGIPIILDDEISAEESNIRIHSYYDKVWGDMAKCLADNGLPIKGCVASSISTIGPPQECGKTDLLYCKDYPGQTDQIFEQFFDYRLSLLSNRIFDSGHKLGYRLGWGAPVLRPLIVDEETPRSQKLRELELTGNFFKDVNLHRSAVLFAPFDFFQIDGYVRSELVAGEDYSSGRITQAECQIFWSHPPDVVRQFVSECVLRSLGLVNVTVSKEPSVLAANRSPRDLGRYPMPTEWDLKLLRLFYNPELEPGSNAELIRASLNRKAANSSGEN